MTISRFTPPLDYLQAASRASLQSFELTRLNHSANLRREISALIDQWIQETSAAMLARWMLDHHQSLQSDAMSSTDVIRTLVDSVSSLFPEAPPPISEIVPAPPPLRHSRRPSERIDRTKTSKTTPIRGQLTSPIFVRGSFH